MHLWQQQKMDQVLPDTHMEGQDEGFGSDLSSGYLGTEPADGRYLSLCLLPRPQLCLPN